jgi:hypothetical protein
VSSLSGWSPQGTYGVATGKTCRRGWSDVCRRRKHHIILICKQRQAFHIVVVKQRYNWLWSMAWKHRGMWRYASLMDVSSQLHTPVTRLGELNRGVWTLWATGKCSVPAGNRSPAVQPSARRYINPTIPTETADSVMSTDWCLALSLSRTGFNPRAVYGDTVVLR